MASRRYNTERKNYFGWGPPQYVNGRWQIRRMYKRAGNYQTIGFTTYFLTKKR